MASVYKYAEREWSELFIRQGGVRIGTLHNFRKQEHAKGIADVTEGRKTIYHAIDSYNSSSPRRIDHLALNNLGFSVPYGSNVSLGGFTIARDFNSPDCYVHCTAHALSREVLDQFAGFDSCVEIFKPTAFYRKLTEIINKITPVHFYGLRKIIYSDRNETFNGEDFGRRPYLMKETGFSPQCEVRAVWIPRSAKKIEPFNIQDKSLIRFCRSVDIP